MLKYKIKNGYSIVEIIIYLAIFTFISIFVINSFITIMSSFWVTNSNRNILESGITSLERITREIRQAENIDITTTNTSLVLNGQDELGNSRTIQFVLEDDTLNFYEDSNLIGSLVNPNIIVSDLSFSTISTIEGSAVRVGMTLSNTNPNYPRSEKFYSTIILRGSY